jgi:hypothetical protein
MASSSSSAASSTAAAATATPTTEPTAAASTAIPTSVDAAAAIANHGSIASVHRLVEIWMAEFALRTLDTESEVGVIHALFLLFGVL